MERALARSRDRFQDPRPSKRRIRLMIVDDSMVARAVLSRMIESDPAFEICAVAGTAEDAIEALDQVRVDIILLDLEMPGAGGLKSIPRIIAAAAGAKVLIVSSLAEEGAEQTVAALALGAADTLPKPGAGRFRGRFAEILLAKLKALGRASARLPEPVQPRPGSQPLLRAMPADPIDVLAIGASTGGIHALGVLFEALPKRIGVPILVTQHLPTLFMPVFRAPARRCCEARLRGRRRRDAFSSQTGSSSRPAMRICAVEPGERGTVVRLTRGRSLSGCMPSVDPMFASVGAVFGAGALGVVLTGMGRDGVEGAGRMVACGGAVIAQDEASCAVWGMPRAVLEAGLACAVLPPDEIARRISRRTEEQATCR